jgi:hypothetical protein
MIVEFHTLYWPNINKDIVECHKKVTKHFGFDVNYHEEMIDHGEWMTRILDKAKSDVIVFLDIDCVPINGHGIWSWIESVRSRKTFVGVAQVSNHIPPAEHIYAAPAFFAIYKECWDKIKVPMVAGSDGKHVGDVCELFCYAAEEQKIPYNVLMPEVYYKPSKEGLWKLADKGYYGIGTIFGGAVYHLYQSRYAENVELFKKHCDQLISYSLQYSDFINATEKP